tara:strand:- start:4 stop:645 length:642 start_codon:yes stop_codon:yes gene_type:complete
MDNKMIIFILILLLLIISFGLYYFFYVRSLGNMSNTLKDDIEKQTKSILKKYKRMIRFQRQKEELDNSFSISFLIQNNSLNMGEDILALEKVYHRYLDSQEVIYEMLIKRIVELHIYFENIKINTEILNSVRPKFENIELVNQTSKRNCQSLVKNLIKTYISNNYMKNESNFFNGKKTTALDEYLDKKLQVTSNYWDSLSVKKGETTEKRVVE